MWYMQDLFSSIYLAGIETNPFILLFGLYGVPNRAWGTATLVLRWPPNTQAQAYTHTHTHTQAHTSTVHLEPPPSLWILIQLLCWWLHNLVQRQVFITVKSINDTARLSMMQIAVAWELQFECLLANCTLSSWWNVGKSIEYADCCLWDKAHPFVLVHWKGCGDATQTQTPIFLNTRITLMGWSSTRTQY